MWTGWAPYAITAFYCFITFMVAVLAWSRGYKVGKDEGFHRGFRIGRTRSRAEKAVTHGD